MYRRVTIRQGGVEDEADLFSLARDVFGDRQDFREGRTLQVLDADLLFVAEIEGGVAGYAAVERSGEAVRIEQLLVSPVHDDEHVEEQLIDYAEGYAISVAARRLEVIVEGDNEAARAVFRERGFVAAGPELLELRLPDPP
jgi:N-acetylglutamate synthase-like GNAT family acetyltransferase